MVDSDPLMVFVVHPVEDSLGIGQMHHLMLGLSEKIYWQRFGAVRALLFCEEALGHDLLESL